MNCSTLLSRLGFNCEPLPSGAMRLLTPFTYGEDGELIGVYVEPIGDRLRVTDHADSLFHASAMGATLNKQRLARLAGMMRGRATLSPGGEISAMVEREEDLAEAVIDVVDSALVVSHLEASWLPKAHDADFQYRLERLLAPSLGVRLKRRAKVVGASGNQLEIPLMIVFSGGARYVQPVARGQKGLDWSNVYKAYGKMADLKQAGADDEARYVVIEDDLDSAEIDNAVSFLADSANVLRFSRHDRWLQKLTAA